MPLVDTVREACRKLGRRAGKASAAKRREKQLSTQTTLPVFTREPHYEISFFTP
jgi:hypothetical protein